MKSAVLILLACAPVWCQVMDRKPCETLKRHGDAAGANACYQRLSRSTDLGTQAEGLWGMGNVKAANDAFRAAVKAHDKDATLRARWGRLYLEKSQESDATDLFKEALELDEKNAEALYGMALFTSDNYQGEAVSFAEKTLKSDPKFYQAHELLAKIDLEDDNPAKAQEEAKKALETTPEALDALAILATMDFLNDKPTSEWADRIFKINPRYGDAYALVGHFFVINRRYDEGIQYYRKAIAIEPELYSAKSELGVNLMRFAQNTEAYALLKEAFENGYQSHQTTNSLTLMDSYKKFKCFDHEKEVDCESPVTGTTRLKVHSKEAALIRPYFQAELDRDMADYEKKYKHKLNGPVQIEVYPDHEDFAVRTMGLPGLGALGVTFGQYVAMDSPSGRPPGQFHWASTLRHEMSHVYVLSMTKHRVPRWFTEGVAVYEETASSPDWGDRLDHLTLGAVKDKKLLPIADLDRGFVHPTYPNQVIVSYFQGGKILTFIAEKWGSDKVLAMIHAYAELKTTPEVIEQELKLKPEEFDKQFNAWLEAQLKPVIDGYDTWRKQVGLVATAVKTKDWDFVIKEGLAIRDLFPEYVEGENVYEAIAKAYEAKGDKAKEMDQLKLYSDVGGRNPESLEKLAKLQADAGLKRDAATTLERLSMIFLSSDKAHQSLGDLDMDLGNAAGAIREYQAVLAGKPIDPAAAHYGLARAFQSAHRTAEARDEALSALEVAPGFKPAQKLFLELSAEGPKKQ